MQIDKLFTAIWHDTTTWPWTPLTGLSATITIRDKSTNTVVVDNETMTEIGLGEYDYTFESMVSTKSYSYVMSPNSTLAYVVSWFVDPRMANMDWAITDIRGGGGFSVNLSGVTGSITNLQKNLIEKIDKLPKVNLNEIKSHIDIANQSIIDTIKETESYICKDIKKTNTELSKDNVATRQLIRQKSDKIDKNVSKLADRQDLTDKMIEDEADELEEEIDKLYEKEADDLEKEIDDQLNQEFDQIETEINHITNGNN